MISRNQRLLTLAAKSREAAHAAILQAEASILNVMETRIGLEVTAVRSTGSPTTFP